jgi:mannose-6-phosphate isomerase-like protein (cupin superfamily)/catechol 2,3-dioxygenase-like lactoylglutathione lyase family enzyme
MTITEPGPNPTEPRIVSEPATSRAWWFLGTLAVLRNPPGASRTPVVMELTVPPGGSPPLHVHTMLDDSFLLLDGEVVVRCGEVTDVVRPGGYVVMPHGVEHTFRVTSSTPARMLLVHADDSFLGFVEAIGTPTQSHRLPASAEFDLDFDVVARVSAEHGSPMVGPSLEEDEARAFAGERARPTLGPVNHVSLHVTDVSASERWYVDAFGLVRIDGEIAEDGTGHVVLLHAEGGWIVTLMSAPAPRVEHVAFTCADRDMLVRWHDVLHERGVIPGSITDAAHGSGFVLRDPDGVEMELFAPARMTG